MKIQVIVCLVLLASQAVQAEGIDLDCGTQSEQLIRRLSSEGLLAPGADSARRARKIGIELCSGAQASAQEQHEAGKQEALDNWFFEERPDKPGNKRLRNLKR